MPAYALTPALARASSSESMRQLIHDMPTIGLEELNSEAALQTRVDRKYILNTAQVEEIVGQLDPEQTKVLEIDGVQDQRYRSLYFDTPEHASYRMAATGRRRRFKIRTRVYEDTNQAFVELKVRGARGTTVKDRIEQPVDIARADQIDDKGWEWIADSLAGTGMQGIVPELGPSLWGTYRRTTLLIPDGRVTIDNHLTWRNNSTCEHSFPNMVIIETKSSGGATSFDHSLWDAGVRPAKISKFGTGAAALDSTLPSNKWNRTLQRHFAFSTINRPGR